jgi:hypothetical protein
MAAGLYADCDVIVTSETLSRFTQRAPRLFRIACFPQLKIDRSGDRNSISSFDSGLLQGLKRYVGPLGTIVTKLLDDFSVGNYSANRPADRLASEC